MKRALIFLTISVTAVLFGACNKHSWEGEDGQKPVKKLFQEHGGHGDEGGAKEAHPKKEGDKPHP